MKDKKRPSSLMELWGRYLSGAAMTDDEIARVKVFSKENLPESLRKADTKLRLINKRERLLKPLLTGESHPEIPREPIAYVDTTPPHENDVYTSRHKSTWLGELAGATLVKLAMWRDNTPGMVQKNNIAELFNEHVLNNMKLGIGYLEVERNGEPLIVPVVGPIDFATDMTPDRLFYHTPKPKDEPAERRFAPLMKLKRA